LEAGGVKTYLATAMLTGMVVLAEKTLSALIYSQDVFDKIGKERKMPTLWEN